MASAATWGLLLSHNSAFIVKLCKALGPEATQGTTGSGWAVLWEAEESCT